MPGIRRIGIGIGISGQGGGGQSLTFTLTSIEGGVQIDWTPVSGYYTEIWASIDGADYVLLTTAGLDVDTYNHTGLEGNIVDYKLRTKSVEPLDDQEAETQTLIAASRYDTVPTNELQNLINTTIAGLKTDGVWADLDILYVLGLHESKLSRQNWISDAYNCLVVGSPTFTSKQGFRGAASAGLNTQYKPASHAVNFALTDASLGAMSISVSETTDQYMFGALGTGDNLGTFQTAGAFLVRLNSENNYGAGPQLTDAAYVGYTRSGNNVQGYLNGATSGALTANNAAASLIDREIGLLCYNAADVFAVTGTYSGILSTFWMGKGLDATKQLAIYTRLKYFYDNVGGTF